MHRPYLLIATAILEAGTVLGLLIVPSVPFAPLLGLTQAAPEVLLVGRVAGAALLALGVASWLARGDRDSPAAFGLLTGVLIYDVAAAGILLYAGTALNTSGVAPWPAVAIHAVLAVWCVLCLWGGPRGAGRDAQGGKEKSAMLQ